MEINEKQNGGIMKKKPWLNEAGNAYSDAELKEKSKNWTLEDWEWFQKEGLHKLEALSNHIPYGNKVEELFSATNSIWDYIGDENKLSIDQKSLRSLKTELGKLSSRERKVLQFFYIQEMTDKEIALIMNEKMRTILRCRVRSLTKLKNAIKNNTDLKSMELTF